MKKKKIIDIAKFSLGAQIVTPEGSVVVHTGEGIPDGKVRPVVFRDPHVAQTVIGNTPHLAGSEVQQVLIVDQAGIINTVEGSFSVDEL